MAGESNPNYESVSSTKLVNKEGLLELSKNIKAYVAANAGGGTTYTAGTGISIDANGVISLALANASQEEM